MLEIIKGSRVSELDKAFVQSKGISSWDLMESAATSFLDWFKIHFKDCDKGIFIFCGPGNNGGDGLAIARLLEMEGYGLTVVTFEDFMNCSHDYQINFKKLPIGVRVISHEGFDYDQVQENICVDAIFGVGVNRPLSGKYLECINLLNQAKSQKIAIDMPSGIPSDGILEGTAFHADFTCSFQFPKMGLLIPEHADYTGKVEILEIGIPSVFLKSFSQNRFFLQRQDIPLFHKHFNNFSHKGDFGRILLIGGSKGKMGAILLSSKAALRTGSGLVHVHAPFEERFVLQIGAPEVMVSADLDFNSLAQFDAVGIGPGWGVEIDSYYLEKILKSAKKPVVIDADGLNLLSKNKHLLDLLPLNSILTPHLKEFERLVGPSTDHFDRLDKAREFSSKFGIYLILKGAYTSISCPEGFQYFNSSGTKYMATAGAGDVLTGIITSFLGQGYNPLHAAICGVYHHGLAGELASKNKRRGMIASDIIEAIPETYLNLGID
ncbi:NAD(P)H-hydrate dehydratase [Cognataquiflexum rubidum]|uniref:NAD(P)H-hydrate dehydratase n=1 Tax=Cognataquiflexum rubidum TaxID=2922273 RepID=UPI001F146AD1|nr:NAD(P)H-hydrate dehydratase [Cognataquiflexum rubidum]MCH6235871.1 NAD(P)H-hydrate dehydratase [Cognataquiflexum rubidum]